MLVRQSVLLLAHIRAGTAVNTSYQASNFNSNISINILVLYCTAPTAMKFCWCYIKTLAHVMLKSYSPAACLGGCLVCSSSTSIPLTSALFMEVAVLTIFYVTTNRGSGHAKGYIIMSKTSLLVVYFIRIMI